MRYWLALAMLISACGDDGPCNPARQACRMSHDFGVQVMQPGQEKNGLCQSWTLHNDTDLWVNVVEMQNGGAYHHSNWFYVHDNTFTIPDGAWDCEKNGFNEVAAAVAGGVLYAQSTQVRDERQVFPAGVAVKVPARSRIIANTHLLNASPNAVSTDLKLTLLSIPPAEARVKLAPFRMQYTDLHIPAMSSAEFTTTCQIDQKYQEVVGSPFALKLYYVLPHYHSLGTRLDVRLAGGPRDGELLFQHVGYTDTPGGKSYDPPIDVAAAGATGLSMTCAFQNPRSVDVGWGIGDQEMCVMLGFADTGMAFDGEVASGTGSVTGMQNGTVFNSAPCSVIGFAR